MDKLSKEAVKPIEEILAAMNELTGWDNRCAAKNQTGGESKRSKK